MRRAILAALVAATACTGTDVGNPVVDLSFASYNPDRGDAVVTGAWIAVERIRLRPASDCEGGAELEIDGPLVVDLRAEEPLAALTGLEVESQAYCRLELAWHVADPAELPPDAPDALAGAAIALEGEAGALFVIRSERNDELRIEAVDAGGFTIDEATSALFVAFDLAAWIAGVDFDAAQPEPDGVIVVDPDRNPDQLEVFEDNLAAAARLFDDDDGDGQLDEEERGDDDLLAAP